MLASKRSKYYKKHTSFGITTYWWIKELHDDHDKTDRETEKDKNEDMLEVMYAKGLQDFFGKIYSWKDNTNEFYKE